jgi:hypothetical protein
MNMKSDSLDPKVWLFCGSPDLASAAVPDASAMDGGYIMVLVLRSGAPRIIATRFPGRNVTSWKTQTTRYGGETLTTVMVTNVHQRYLNIKRLLTQQLAAPENPQADLPLNVDQIVKQVTELFRQLTPVGTPGQRRATDLAIQL